MTLTTKILRVTTRTLLQPYPSPSLTLFPTIRLRTIHLLAKYTGSGIGTGTGSESSSESEEEDRPDVGTLDESNVLAGKRQRTKVDYRKLNDAMFGEVDEDDAAKMFGKEEEEYNWAKEMSKKSHKRRSSSSSSSSGSSSSDESSSSDDDSRDDDTAGDSARLKSKSKAASKAKKEDKPKSLPKAARNRKKPTPRKKTSANSTTPAKTSARKLSKDSKGAPSSGEPVKKKRKYTKRSDGYWSNRSGVNSPTAKAMAKKAAAASAMKGATPAKTSTQATKKRKYIKKSACWSSSAKQKSA